MARKNYIPTPNEIGQERIGDVLMCDDPNRPIMLHALVYLVGISLADLAKQTGLTPSRMGHYLNYKQPVPVDRQRQFYTVLKGIIEAYEENLAAIDERPEEFEAILVSEAVPVLRAIVEACRKVLADYEATEMEAAVA